MLPPLERLLQGRALGILARLANRLQAAGARVWMELFAYQFVLRARKSNATSRYRRTHRGSSAESISPAFARRNVSAVARQPNP